ncbi:hypothetical protein Z945_2942 [Sulfitobacter noctilucae]|nr:hypothetical protein Z945_2942 [Sulfitobacter noctilucae]
MADASDKRFSDGLPDLQAGVQASALVIKAVLDRDQPNRNRGFTKW